jgi:acetyl esterase/lipase
MLKGIQYGTISIENTQIDLLLDLYLPEGSLPPFPTLVYIHGGGWMEGSRRYCPGETFAVHGYAVASIDYRLASIHGHCKSYNIFPAQIHDIKASVRWLRVNASEYGLDPQRFAAIGDSSGGHLSSLLGVSHGVEELQGELNAGASDAVQAVVDWYGPVDVLHQPPEVAFDDDPCQASFTELRKRYVNQNLGHFYWSYAWGVFLGGSLRDKAMLERARHASPLTYVSPDAPPFLVLHGAQDEMIPVSQSRLLVDALRSAGVEVTFKILEGKGHSYSAPGVEVLPSFLEPTLEFLDRHFKNG